MTLTIGELARKAATKAVTIRYYERLELLPTPQRTAGNYRVYEADHLGRLRFIRRCRNLGFTLDQVRDLLRLASREDQECSAVDRLTADHLAAVERKIADLTQLAHTLRGIRSRCRGGGTIASCQILEALSPEAVDV